MDDKPAGMTSRQVASWRRSGLVSSGEGEIAQLRLIAALRRAGVGASRVRVLLRWLRATSAEPPHRLTFALRGTEVYVGHPDGSWEGDSRLGQLILVPDGDGALRPTDLSAWSDPLFSDPLFTVSPPRAARRRPASPATDRDAIRHYLATENHREGRS